MMQAKAQNEFINILKNKLNDVNHELIGDYFYEWEVENWSKISKKQVVYSPEFYALGHKWKLELYPNGVDVFYKGNISLYLYRDNEEDDCCVHLAVNRVFFIKNYYDSSCYQAATLPIEYLGKSIPSSGHPNLISTSKLYTVNGYNNKSLVEKNKCIFGVYFQIYKTEKGLFEREITCYIDDENKVVKDKYFYEWEVRNWSRNKSTRINSPEFTVGGLRFTLDLYKAGDGYDNRKYVSIFLKCLNPGYNRNGTWINAIIFIRNSYKDSNCYCYDVLEMRKIDVNNIDWGFSKLIKQKDLYKKNINSKYCLVENDKCVIGAYIHVYEEGKVNLQINNGPGQSSSNCPTYQDPPPYSSINTNPTPLFNNVPPVQPYPLNQNPVYPNGPYQSPSFSNSPYPYPNPPYSNPPYPNPPYSNPPYPNPPYQYPPYPNNQPYQNPPPSYYSNPIFPPNQNLNNNAPVQHYPPNQNLPYQDPPPMYYPNGDGPSNN